MSSESPYLSAYLQIPGQPHLVLEGVWENKFERFRGQVLPPGNIGGSIAKVEADSSKVNVTTIEEGEVLPQVLASFEEFLKHLKPVGLRKIVCGNLWGQKGRWFSRRDKSDQCSEGIFIIKDTKSFPGFVTVSCINTNETQSEFIASFWKSSIFSVKITEIKWVGKWGEGLAPKDIYFGDEINTIHLAVDEFE